LGGVEIWVIKKRTLVPTHTPRMGIPCRRAGVACGISGIPTLACGNEK